MKKKLITFGLSILILLCLTAVMSACGDDKKESSDYNVTGIWHARETWHEDSPYNYGGYNFELNVWFEFCEGGAMRNRVSLTANDKTMSDTGWVIFNGTWSVEGNKITLSSGKTYMIVDDEFNDTYPNPKMILHFYKEN